MNKKYLPKGRASLPNELLQFGRHLVYSEGTKTEPYYIDNIKRCIAKKYACNQNDIEIIPTSKDGKSFNTMSLVSYAVNDVNRRIKSSENINGVWVMFDKDEFPDFFDAHNKIISLNNSTDYNEDGFKYNTETGIAWHSCWSNESFELWLCLYFSYYDSANTRKDYITRKISILSKLCLIATVNLCFLGSGGAICIVTLKPQQSHFLLGLISTIRSVSPCSVVMPLYDVHKSLSTTKQQEKHSRHIDITFSICRIFFTLHL